MSQQGSATGSNPQESEGDILAAADAQIISETLNHYVDQWVIRYRFGAVTPKAYFQLQPQVQSNQELELKIDQALINWGVPRGKKDLLEKYARPEPDADDELVSSPAPASPFGASASGAPSSDRPSASGAALANEAAPSSYTTAALAMLVPAQRAVLQPVLGRLGEIAAMTDATTQRAALTQFRADLPKLTRSALTQVPSLARAWEQVLSPAAIDGWIASAKAQK
jgi:hypothetical protein